MRRGNTRPLSVTIAVGLLAFYAITVILLDLLSPFERPYAQGPVSVVLGIRVFGIWAQLMHGLQLIVAATMAYGLWTMRRWGWYLVLFTAGYMLLSNVIWAAVYQEFARVFVFTSFYILIVMLLLVLTYPHRGKFA